MLLNINDDRKVPDPTPEDLAMRLPEVGPDEYSILTRADEEYIQFYHNDDDTFLLEYRDGSHERHFAEASGELSIGDVVEAFVEYLQGGDRWKTRHAWTQVEFDADFEGDDFNTHYLLEGEEYHRVRVGREREPVAEEGAVCLECEAEFGDYHAEGCLAEECPRCHGPLHACDCE